MSRDLIKYLNIDEYISVDFIFEDDLIEEKIKYVLLNSEIVTGYKINTIDGFKTYPVIEPREYFEKCLTVPLHQGLSKDDIRFVCSKIEDFIA